MAALVYLFALLLASAWALMVAAVLFPVTLATRFLKCAVGRRQASARH